MNRFALLPLATALALALLFPTAGYTQPCANVGGCWTGLADGTKVWTSKTDMPNPQLGVGMVPDAAIAVAAVEPFRFAVNPYARLVDFDMNHLGGWVVESRNGAAFRIDLRWDLGVPAFMWMTRQQDQHMPGTYETTKMVLTGAGNLGIGTVSPQAKLDVNGNITASGSITGNSVINAVYQDVAEWVPASEDLDPATVVVLDPKHDNQVMPSSRAYDTSVAGVVSANPGVLLGTSAANREKIATTGRVKVKVDATKNPIAIGDLLVTSDRSGMAMKSEPLDLAGTKIHRPGTVIGKALQPLAGGEGEILVLLSLQ